jgi:hypothetical protein
MSPRTRGLSSVAVSPHGSKRSEASPSKRGVLNQPVKEVEERIRLRRKVHCSPMVWMSVF